MQGPRSEDEFVRWFLGHANALGSLGPDGAVGVIVDQLAKLDDSLSAEIARCPDSTYELIVSAGGHPDLFPLVKSVCVQLVAPGWRVIALKPARGFDFTINSAGGRVSPSSFRFAPMESKRKPDELGVRLFAPSEMHDALADMTGLILETGLGEESAALIEYVEVAPLQSDSDGIGIHDLSAFVHWWHARRAENRRRS